MVQRKYITIYIKLITEKKEPETRLTCLKPCVIVGACGVAAV
jgi:hypothetical protein